jgi:hypothetical protein
MRLTREHLAERFKQLDAELGELKASGSAEEELWRAIEAGTHVPSTAISDADRRWWWQQLYDLTERHGLTDLSRPRSKG